MIRQTINNGNLTFSGGGFNFDELTVPLVDFTEYEPTKYYWPDVTNPTDLAAASAYLLEIPPSAGLLLASARCQVTSPPPGLRLTAGLVTQSKTDLADFSYIATLDMDPTAVNGQTLSFSGPIRAQSNSFLLFVFDFAGIGAPGPGPAIILSDVALALIV